MVNNKTIWGATAFLTMMMLQVSAFAGNGAGVVRISDSGNQRIQQVGCSDCQAPEASCSSCGVATVEPNCAIPEVTCAIPEEACGVATCCDSTCGVATCDSCECAPTDCSTCQPSCGAGSKKIGSCFTGLFSKGNKCGNACSSCDTCNSCDTGCNSWDSCQSCDSCSSCNTCACGQCASGCGNAFHRASCRFISRNRATSSRVTRHLDRSFRKLLAGSEDGSGKHCYFSPEGCGGKGCPPTGCYSMIYSANPQHFDQRDGQVYAAQGYGGPVAVPLAPNVQRAGNYSWGIPSSRLTPVSRVAP